jgi:DNA-binding MarR family transcriptional regulator
VSTQAQPRNRIDGVRPPTELLRDFTQLSRRFERKIEAMTAVNPTDRVVMETLIQRGPLSPGELAEAVRITPAAMTASVDRLIDMGHVNRDNHPTDRRRIVVTASPESVALIMAELRAMVVDVNDVLTDYSSDQLAVITEFLEKVNSAYSRHVDNVD